MTHKKIAIKKSTAYFALVLSCFTVLPAFAAYSYSADGSEVIDSATGLIWRRCPEGMAWSSATCTGIATSYTHEQALAKAKSEATTSGKAWRIPNVKELSSITQLGVSANPSIDGFAFPATPASWFWSSSRAAGAFLGSAWGVHFRNGSNSDSSGNYRFNGGYVRLVR